MRIIAIIQPIFEVEAAHKEAADYPPMGRRQLFMRRNSFIKMAKLHNLSGRIVYISSHAKQEHLYEAYATEPDRAFILAGACQMQSERSG